MLVSAAVKELQERHGWSESFTAQVYPFYVATLRSLSLGRQTPVFKVIDDMWHAHLLCTRDYMAFCDREFGRFVHHDKCEDGEQGATLSGDFLDDFGLSFETLQELCGTQPGYFLESELNCAQTDHAQLSTAKCGQNRPRPVPSPPRTDMSLARCGQPDQPGLPVARCGQPSPAPPTVRAEMAIAKCGVPEEEPAQPPGVARLAMAKFGFSHHPPD